MHMAYFSFLRFDMYEVDIPLQHHTVPGDHKSLRSEEVHSAGRDEERSGIASEVGSRGHLRHPLLVGVVGAQEPLHGTGIEESGVIERSEVVCRAVEKDSEGMEEIRPEGHVFIFGTFSDIEGEMRTGRPPSDEHVVFIEP